MSGREMSIKMNDRRRLNVASARIVWLKVFICLLLLLPLCWLLRRGSAQSGVLIPSTSDKPNVAALSLQSMNVDVLIDNQHARVRVLQIFDSHVAQALEGKYLFALPPRASVADFAVWDGDMRIPGVMMEKRRANAVYSQIKQQQVDPGLLQQDDEHEGSSAFSAKVFPIPAYGTKRIEMEYTEVLPVESLTSHFTFPLKPSFGDPERVAEFNLHLHVLSDYPISVPAPGVDSYPLKITKSEAGEFEGNFQARELELKEDFAFDYRIDVPDSALSLIAYRAPEQISAYDLRDPALSAPNPDGYFEARAIYNQSHRPTRRENVETARDAAASNTQPRNVLVLLDTSLSMRGDKLARAFEAVEYFLHNLTPRDQFNLLLFNSETAALSDKALPATPEQVERALDFVRASSLGGGTDLRKALAEGLALADHFPAGERNVVLISDANPTLGTTDAKKILRVLKDKEGAGTSCRA